MFSRTFKACSFSGVQPLQAVKTNILGAQNIIDASYEIVKSVLALALISLITINIYGATKLASDKLFIA